MKLIRLLCLVLVTTICFIQQASATEVTMNEEELAEFVKQVIRDNPDLIFNTVNDYIKDKSKDKKEEQFKSSLENRLDVDIDDSYNPSRGAENAPIVIYEFSEFQCPYCKRASETMDLLLKAYPDSIRLVYKNNPMPNHQMAAPAAKAAMAAHNQGRFWDYHDLLFDAFPNFTEETLVKIAGELDLDMDKFNADRQSEDVAKAIQTDSEQAAKFGLNGRPSFLINGVLVRGAQPQAYFQKVIDYLLSEMKNKG